MSSPIVFSPENESKAIAWLTTRGGIAVWRNVNMSSQSLGSETLTPAQTDGQPTGKPSWQVTLDRIVTDPSQVRIEGKREVSRCKVIRSKYGPPCDPIAKGRIGVDRAMEKAGENAWYEFDYANANYGSAWIEAVIYVPSDSRPLAMPAAQTD